MLEGGVTGQLLTAGCLGLGGIAYWGVVHRIPNWAVLGLAALMAGVAAAVLQ